MIGFFYLASREFVLGGPCRGSKSNKKGGGMMEEEVVVVLHPDGMESGGNFEGLDTFQGVGTSWEQLQSELSEQQGRFNPERACRLKLFFAGLSKEALEVVDLILNVPDELLEFVIGKGTHREVTRNSIRQYLRWHGWERRNVEKIFRELGDKMKKNL